MIREEAKGNDDEPIDRRSFTDVSDNLRSLKGPRHGDFADVLSKLS